MAKAVTNVCPSEKTLMATFSWDVGTAKIIRRCLKAPLPELREAYGEIVPTQHHYRCALVNHFGEFAGVEVLGIHKKTRRTIYYLNAGDTYEPTLVWTAYPERVILTTIGDVVESSIFEELKNG